MALISVVENLVVQQRGLLTHEDMLDGISLATVLPGPIAANVVAYVGYRIRGGWGAVATATSVLLPSFLLVVGLTAVYYKAGEIDAVSRVFAGFIPAVVAIIISAAWRMAKKSIKTWQAIAIATAAGLLIQFIGGFYITLTVIIGAGALGYFLFRSSTAVDPALQAKAPEIDKGRMLISFAILACFLLLYLIPLPFLGEDSLARLFTTFSGMSLMLFGGGYVFIPLIQEVVVDGYGWVTPIEFANAIALGQVTPGPILISAAFIGYAVKGIIGAIVATVGIFFPPALLMVTCSHLLDRIKTSSAIQAALKGIRPAIVGMIFTAAIVVVQTAQPHWATPLIFVGSLVAIWRFHLDVVLVIPIAGLLGLLLYP
ncbi:MAG: chromate efflux transporter [Elainellaceae cyanobacterium]